MGAGEVGVYGNIYNEASGWVTGIDIATLVGTPTDKAGTQSVKRPCWIRLFFVCTRLLTSILCSDSSRYRWSFFFSMGLFVIIGHWEVRSQRYE